MLTTLRGLIVVPMSAQDRNSSSPIRHCSSNGPPSSSVPDENPFPGRAVVLASEIQLQSLISRTTALNGPTTSFGSGPVPPVPSRAVREVSLHDPDIAVTQIRRMSSPLRLFARLAHSATRGAL